MITAFDADVLIYAAKEEQPLGGNVAGLFKECKSGFVGIGSTLLLVEVLIKPMRINPESFETEKLFELISRINMRPVDQHTAELALSLGVKYGLKAIDATHLATAIIGRADRFLTNNRKDFRKEIEEIDIVYPEEL